MVSNIFLCSPLLGQMIQFDEYLSNRLKPPTGIICCRMLMSGGHWNPAFPKSCVVEGLGSIGRPFGIPPLPQTLLRTSCMMCSNSAIHKTRSQEAWCASRYFGPLPRLKWEYRGRLNCEDQSVPCLRDPYVSGRYPT